jgi:hypothetical protein
VCQCCVGAIAQMRSVRSGSTEDGLVASFQLQNRWAGSANFQALINRGLFSRFR